MAKVANSDLKIVSGRVSKIFYYNGDNGWASFVMTFSPQKNKLNIGKNSVKCSGIIPDIKVGDKLTVQGRLEDTKYGLQLNVTDFKDDTIVTEHSTGEEILAFLSSGCVKGVGPRTAVKIFEKYGENSINIIENDYEKLAEVDGIGKKKALKIHANFNLETGVRNIVSALMPYGISPNLAFKLYNKWGLKAVDTVKENPYLMADPELGVEGIGFKKADEVAVKIGIDKHSPLRLQSLIVYLLVHGSMDGNIFYTYEELLKIGEEYLVGISANEVIENLRVLERGGKIIIEENRIYAISMYLKEKFNAEKLVVLNQAILKNCVLDFKKIQKAVGKHIVYDESQKEAIKIASLDTTGVMVLTGGPGSGKAQSLYSKVLTPNGFVRMGDIKVGDKVISGTGNISTVLGVYPQGKKPIYELTFNDGSSCRCCNEHLWTVQTRKDRLSYSHNKFRGQRERTIELNEILKDYKMAKGRLKYSIRYVKPIEFKEKDFYIHPYLLGLLLGDGCLNEESVSISLYDAQLRNDIYKFFPNSEFELSLKSSKTPNVHDYTIKYNGEDSYSEPQHPNMKPLNYNLYKLGLKGKHSYEKFIPKEYLYASEEQRRWLLKGLLDTDGSVLGNGTYIEYSTTSELLKDNIIELVQSLGGYAKASKRRSHYKKDGKTVECRDNYRIVIQFTADNNDCFNLERKRVKYNPKRTSDNVKRYIKDIKYIGEEDCQCIYIDDPSHLYITDNYIITHNTTVTKGIIEMFKQSGYKVLCAAPTGRAAKRMQEATGHKASTIHRLLGCRGANVFDKNEQNPILCDALIIDEASMIDNNLLYRLLLAVKEGTKVLFIGDIDQLPSIGAGNILRDMISSEFFPVVQLKKIHRQGQESLIISNAHAINEGRNIQIKNTEDSDCIFMDVDQMGTDENIVNEIVSLVTKQIPQKYGYDPKEIQVLVPMKKTPLGVNTINDALQKALNTSKEKVATKQATYFVGDKVMQIRNNPEKNVFNGDIGFIKEINDEDKELIVSFPDNDSDSPDMFYDVVYDFRELDEIVLAYACTIHKSQGSEYPAVIMVVSYQHYIMLQRNLIYTGITRAKQLCFILGTNKAIYHASNNVPVQKRNTTLIKRVYEFVDSLDDEDFDCENEEYEEYGTDESFDLDKANEAEEDFQFSYFEE